MIFLDLTMTFISIKYRTKYTAARLLALILAGVLSAFFASGGMMARDKKPTKKQEAAVECNQPDEIAHKAKPDAHPRPLPMPQFGGQGDSQMHGFDFSHYQGRINWNQVATDPNAGYIYLKATEGGALVDDTYRYNFSEAKRVGLKVGSYHFFRATVSAKEQFELFASTVNARSQDLLPLIDVETVGKGVTVYVFHERLEQFLNMVEKEYGTKPLIYTGRNFYERYFYNSRFRGKYKFMIAAYAADQPVLPENDDYLIWQFTASGSARGVRGKVDVSRFVGTHTLREIMYRR